MPLQPQQRSLAILAGVFGGGLLIAFLAVTVFSGGDDQRKIAIGPNQPSTSTSASSTPPTTTISSTLPPTTAVPVSTSVTPATRPVPTTVIIVPPTGAPTPTGAPAPTGTTGTTSPPTPSTTQPPTIGEQLETLLEATLLGDAEPPPPDTPPRVRVTYEAGELLRVSWDLDETLSALQQRYAARNEATALLRAIQDFDGLGDEPITLRALLPDPDDPDQPLRVVRLVFERDTLDAIDFDTLDPLTIFDLADESEIDPDLEPSPPPTTSTSTSSTTSTTSR